MKKTIFLFVGLLLCAVSLAQDRYRTSEGKMQFDASTPLEDIHAVNSKVSAILDVESGQIAVLLLNKEFKFKKRLMEEHFNENYMESDRFPKSVFKGTITDFDPNNLNEGVSKEYPIQGDLVVHGVSRPLQTSAQIKRDGEDIILNIGFNVRTADHDIKVPKLLFKKVAQEVSVSGTLKLSPEVN